MPIKKKISIEETIKEDKIIRYKKDFVIISELSTNYFIDVKEPLRKLWKNYCDWFNIYINGTNTVNEDDKFSINYLRGKYYGR